MDVLLVSTQQNSFKIVRRDVETLSFDALCLKMFELLSTENEQNTTFKSEEVNTLEWVKS